MFGRHHHETVGTVLSALGEQQIYMNPSEYQVHDDINIHDYGLPPTDNVPFSRGQRSRQSVRREVDPPRASYDTISQPPIWSDLMYCPYTYPQNFGLA